MCSSDLVPAATCRSPRAAVWAIGRGCGRMGHRRRAVAQLVAHRSPKPAVVGSSPACPAENGGSAGKIPSAPSSHYLLPSSAVCGAGLVLLADILCRTIVAPLILPISAVTSLVGAPLFIYLLFRGVQR